MFALADPLSPSPRAVHFPVDARPPVLVRHGHRWYRGRLHAWLPEPAAEDDVDRPREWRAVVTFSVGAGLQYYLSVPSDQVRPQDP